MLTALKVRKGKTFQTKRVKNVEVSTPLYSSTALHSVERMPQHSNVTNFDMKFSDFTPDKYLFYKILSSQKYSIEVEL